MAKKILKLKLKYNDKKIDEISADRDFTNKVIIGSDKFIFWQILDNSFPKKYRLASKSGSNWKLNLRDGMDYEVNKNNQKLSKDELKKENILSGKNLILNPNLSGKITFSKKWQIDFSYSIPYKFVPTAEEKAIAKNFSHLPPLSPQQKFTRIFIALGIIFTTIGLYIAEQNYVPPKRFDLVERLEEYRETATQIQPQIVEEVQETRGSGKKDEEEVTDEVNQAQEYSDQEFEQEFGISLDGGIPGGEGTESFNKELFAVKQEEEIVVTGGGGGGSGSGGGSSSSGKGVADLDLAGTGGFDLEGAGEGIGDLSGSGLGIGEGSGFEEVDMSSLSGSIGEYEIHEVKGAADFKAVKKKFAGIKKIKEGNIKVKDVTPEQKSEVANIDQIVTTYKPQLKKLFATESMMMDMYGSIEFTLYILENGTVDAVEVEVAQGSDFTDSFLQKAHKIIMAWKIPVEKPAVYGFRMKFWK